MDNKQQTLGLQTLAVHAGERPDPATRAATPNLVMSTTYLADPDMSFSIEGAGQELPYFYTRWGNPTVTQLEEKLAALEGAEAGLAFASGMAAITALLMHVLGDGGRLVISDVAYAGAIELVDDLLPRMGVEVVKVNAADLEAVARAVTPGTRLVYVETPSNPILRLTDIAAVAEIAQRAGAPLAVDSTFATPVATRPLELGADYVVHSLTKYLGGHGDALGGALLGPAGPLAELRNRVLIHTGGVISPFNAWLILRGLATLPLRMQAHERAALQVARFLEDHPRVRRVVYPGLDSHPQHELAARQMANFSGMMAVQIDDGPRAARVFAERLQVIHYAVSLGHHRSLIFYLPTDEMMANTFKLEGEQLAAYRALAGDGIFRLSVGIEDPDDLCRDLARALSGR